MLLCYNIINIILKIPVSIACLLAGAAGDKFIIMSNTTAKILLVEDEKSLSDMYKTKFEKEGLSVVIASTGEGVAELAEKEKVDLVLLDIILPKVDGFVVLQQLKEGSPTKKIPVIVLTNLAQDEDVSKGKKLGADEYLVKSNLTPAQVVDKIREMLKIK
jgi:DNA-binding response OmpR family regulator